jgi:hypothetical protein
METTPPPPMPVTPPPTPEAAPPPAEEEKLPSIDVGAWIRTAMTFQNANDPKKLNDQSLSAYGELHLGGKVHKYVSYTLNFNADLNGPYNGNTGRATAGIMDAIVGLDFADEIHLWSGQLLTPVDRTNFSGPFFISAWNYPGLFFFTLPGAPGVIPAGEDVYGRSQGTVLWGDFEKGLFKYYLGMMELGKTGDHPLFSGRLNFAPIGKEPGYYSSSTYYGDKDVLAIGIGGQSQKNGSLAKDATGAVTATSNYSEFNADVLAEFKLGDAGVITGEGAYYHFGGDYNPAKDMFFLVGSFLTSAVGPGKFQPMLRYERAWKDGVKVSEVDGQLGYIVKGANMRGILGFSHTEDNDLKGYALQIGLQTIQF